MLAPRAAPGFAWSPHGAQTCRSNEGFRASAGLDAECEQMLKEMYTLGGISQVCLVPGGCGGLAAVLCVALAHWQLSSPTV